VDFRAIGVAGKEERQEWPRIDRKTLLLLELTGLLQEQLSLKMLLNLDCWDKQRITINIEIV